MLSRGVSKLASASEEIARLRRQVAELQDKLRSVRGNVRIRSRTPGETVHRTLDVPTDTWVVLRHPANRHERGLEVQVDGGNEAG